MILILTALTARYVHSDPGLTTYMILVKLFNLWNLVFKSEDDDTSSK